MATATTTALSSATITAATIPGSGRSKQMRNRVHTFNALNSFDGLKAHNNVASLGLPISTEKSFAKIVSSLRKPSNAKNGGGALSSTCGVAGEIFRIAAIMPALVLVGVAVGFVLLRLEAAVEESE